MDALASWLREERQNLITADDLERNTAAWTTHDRDPAWLVTATRLTDAETLATAPGFRGRLAHTREYLAACRHAENQKLAAEEEQRQAELRHAQEREAAAQAVAAAEQRAKLEAQQHAQVLLKRTRVLRAVLALVVIVAVAAVFGFGWAFKAQHDADARFRDATALRLYGESQQMLAGLNPGGGGDVQECRCYWPHQDPIEAARRKYPLLTALHQERDLLKVIDVPATVGSVAFSPDGTRIAWGVGRRRQHGPVVGRRHRAAHRGAAARPRQHGGQRGVQPRWRPDRLGRRDKTIRVWDAATGRPIGEPLRLDDPVISVAFSPDGRRIASGSGDKTVRLWDAGTGSRSGNRCAATTTWCSAWRSAPTAPASPRAVWIKPSGCGTPPPVGRSGSRCAATTTG